MKSIIFAIVILSFFAACRQKESTALDSKSHNNKDTLRNKLIGKWGGREGSPVFQFGRDSIYYFQKDSAYRYYLFGDTLFVSFPENDSLTLFGKIRINKDTLEMIDYQSNNFITKGYRK